MDDLLVCIPIPGRDRYRLSMLASPELVAARQPGGDHGLLQDGAKPSLAHIQAVLDRLAPAGAKAGNLRWSSLFGLSHRIVSRYNVDRVFLAGDAAHIHPPTGAQGMNTGIQDAYNLGWKLALVVKGMAHPSLLDSYDAERRPVGEEVVGRTHQQAEAQHRGEMDRASDRLMKEAQLLVTYRDSPWVAQDLGTADAQTHGPCPGDRAPDVHGLRRKGVGFQLRLFDVFRGTGHVLLFYIDSIKPDHLGPVAEMATSIQAQYGGHVCPYAIVDATAPVDSSGFDGLPTLQDADGAFRRIYHTTTTSALLIRPDGYIAYRCAPVRSDCLTKYLERIFS